MNKHFIIMTLLLCGISQQSSSLYVTHFSPESNDAQNACIIKQDSRNLISEEQVDKCISAMKQYITAMSKRGSDLLTQYNWLMHHTDKLTIEQVAVLKSFKQNLATHEALKTFKMIKSWLAKETLLTERARNLMAHDKAQSIAATLAKGEADLIELEKTIKQYTACANHDNQQ